MICNFLPNQYRNIRYNTCQFRINANKQDKLAYIDTPPRTTHFSSSFITSLASQPISLPTSTSAYLPTSLPTPHYLPHQLHYHLLHQLHLPKTQNWAIAISLCLLPSFPCLCHQVSLIRFIPRLSLLDLFPNFPY